jgi:hypothetical protein
MTTAKKPGARKGKSANKTIAQALAADKRARAEAAKPAPMSSTERVALWRARKAENALAEVRSIYAHPDDHPEIKRVAMKVVRKRERAGRAP